MLSENILVLKMNEKIKKIYIESSIDDNVDSEESLIEKFSVLIIQDVINSIESTGFNHVQKHGLRTTILSNLGYKYPYSEFE